MGWYVARWALAFVFTEAVEVGVYRWALRWAEGERFAHPWLAALVPSLVTHPFVWFAFPYLPLPWVWMVVAAETFAVVVEALLLWRWKVPWALGWSFLANGLSLGLGLLSRSIFGLP